MGTDVTARGAYVNRETREGLSHNFQGGRTRLTSSSSLSRACSQSTPRRTVILDYPSDRILTFVVRFVTVADSDS